MSRQAREWVERNSAAKGSARSVLDKLAWAADPQGRDALRTQRQLASVTGMSVRTIQRRLVDLERLGMIRRHNCSPKCPKCKAAPHRAIVYDVVMLIPEAVNPAQEVLPLGVLGSRQPGGNLETGSRQLVVQEHDKLAPLKTKTREERPPLPPRKRWGEESGDSSGDRNQRQRAAADASYARARRRRRRRGRSAVSPPYRPDADLAAVAAEHFPSVPAEVVHSTTAWLRCRCRVEPTVPALARALAEIGYAGGVS